MAILVTGATGNVGSQVVRELNERGAGVRAFVRDPARAAELLGPEVEPVTGDLSDAAAIRRALDGVERVFLSSADGPQKVAHEAAVIDAAEAAGVELVVKASTMQARAGSPLPPLDWNGRVEEHLRRSAVPGAVLGSGFYMTNLLMPGAFIAPAGQGRIAMIGPCDIGAVAAVVLTTDGHAGETYRLTGPEAISYERAAAELAAATGEEVEYADVPPEAAQAALAAAGLPGWLLAHLIGMYALIRADAFARTTGTVQALTGRPARTWARFAQERAARPVAR